jgi:hypothetical protein
MLTHIPLQATAPSATAPSNSPANLNTQTSEVYFTFGTNLTHQTANAAERSEVVCHRKFPIKKPPLTGRLTLLSY